MLVKFVQPSNGLITIFVTELGITMDLNPEALEKATKPMVVTEFGIIVFSHPIIKELMLVSITALQLFRES